MIRIFAILFMALFLTGCILSGHNVIENGKDDLFDCPAPFKLQISLAENVGDLGGYEGKLGTQSGLKIAPGFNKWVTFNFWIFFIFDPMTGRFRQSLSYSDIEEISEAGKALQDPPVYKDSETGTCFKPVSKGKLRCRDGFHATEVYDKVLSEAGHYLKISVDVKCAKEKAAYCVEGFGVAKDGNKSFDIGADFSQKVIMHIYLIPVRLSPGRSDVSEGKSLSRFIDTGESCDIWTWKAVFAPYEKNQTPNPFISGEKADTVWKFAFTAIPEITTSDRIAVRATAEGKEERYNPQVVKGWKNRRGQICGKQFRLLNNIK